jgi:hypothetical protein
MLLLPPEIESMALAGVELESLTQSIGDRLREANVATLPGALRTCGAALGADVWRMEIRAGIRRERRMLRVEKNTARLWALLDESVSRLPSLESHRAVGRELIARILEQLDRLSDQRLIRLSNQPGSRRTPRASRAKKAATFPRPRR